MRAPQPKQPGPPHGIPPATKLGAALLMPSQGPSLGTIEATAGTGGCTTTFTCNHAYQWGTGTPHWATKPPCFDAPWLAMPPAWPPPRCMGLRLTWCLLNPGMGQCASRASSQKHGPEPLDAPLSGRTDAQALVAWVWLRVDIPSPKDLVYKWSLPTHPLVGWMGACMPVPRTSQRDLVVHKALLLGLAGSTGQCAVVR